MGEVVHEECLINLYFFHKSEHGKEPWDLILIFPQKVNSEWADIILIFSYPLVGNMPNKAPKLALVQLFNSCRMPLHLAEIIRPGSGNR